MSPGLPHSTPRGGASEATDGGHRFRELEVVYALEARPELGIARGEHGTIVHAFQNEPAYLVEFVDDDGTTRVEADFTADQISRTPPA
jgi:hypothetical protein